MVGNHPTPGPVTDLPEVGVEGGHAGGEASQVVAVKLPFIALYSVRVHTGLITIYQKVLAFTCISLTEASNMFKVSPSRTACRGAACA